MKQKHDYRASSPDSAASRGSRVVRAVIKDTIMIVVLVTLALILKSNTIELFKIPTGSMEPTLYGAGELGRGFGDHILVLRCAYGLNSKVKIPIIGKSLPLPDYRVMLPGMRMPRVGEVVVFESPVDKRIDYIKRCCGTPGDRVYIEDGRVYVNGRVSTNSPSTVTVHYTNQGILCDRFSAVRAGVNEVISKRGDDSIKDALKVNGRSYREVERLVRGEFIEFSPTQRVSISSGTVQTEVIVPENSFFMLGDNSAHSSDSRYWGFATVDHLKGKAWVIYLPIKRIRVIR